VTVIVIEHVVRVVMRLCDRVLVLDAGEVVGLGARRRWHGIRA